MNRILVAGGGLIGARHLAAVAAHPRCTLAGLVDPDPTVPAPEGVARYGDISEVREPVDGIILATPTQLHSIQGVHAAAQGWHMLIEKPVAGNLADAHTLGLAVRDAGVGSLVGHHRRYHASVQRLKAMIEDGAIGTPVAVSLIWAMRKPDSYFEGNWRTTGGSPVMINLVHDIDVLRFVLGEIVATSAMRGLGQRGGSRIESGAIALAFESGATGTISFADTTPSPWGFEAGTGENPNIGKTGQDMMWIMGTSGGISFPSLSLWSGRDWHQAAMQQPRESPPGSNIPLEAQLDHFLEVIGGATPLIDVADATRTLEVALRIEEQLAAQGTGGEHARSATA